MTPAALASGVCFWPAAGVKGRGTAHMATMPLRFVSVISTHAPRPPDRGSKALSGPYQSRNLHRRTIHTRIPGVSRAKILPQPPARLYLFLKFTWRKFAERRPVFQKCKYTPIETVQNGKDLPFIYDFKNTVPLLPYFRTTHCVEIRRQPPFEVMRRHIHERSKRPGEADA